MLVSRSLLGELENVLLRHKFRRYLSEDEASRYVDRFRERATMMPDPSPASPPTPKTTISSPSPFGGGGLSRVGRSASDWTRRYVSARTHPARVPRSPYRIDYSRFRYGNDACRKFAKARYFTKNLCSVKFFEYSRSDSGNLLNMWIKSPIGDRGMPLFKGSILIVNIETG